jgi:hypothetical protein
MSEETVRFQVTPNRLRASGAESLDAIAMQLDVTEESLQVVLRTGRLSKRTLELQYGDLEAVRESQGVTFDLVVETADTTYTVTNVTGERTELENILSFVQKRIRELQQPDPEPTREQGTPSGTSQNGASSGSGGAAGTASASASAATDGAGAGSDAMSVTEQLKEWAELREQGIISDEEFERKKQELL